MLLENICAVQSRKMFNSLNRMWYVSPENTLKSSKTISEKAFCAAVGNILEPCMLFFLSGVETCMFPRSSRNLSSF